LAALAAGILINVHPGQPVDAGPEAALPTEVY
jgi:hypothetical protein